jgi:2-polyprenyl-6-methoxyphenol hydroxylase-like FAD-dependent oxidoreductase
MEAILSEVAIIGGGLGGCALALALTDLDVPVTIYESRPPNSEEIASGVLLSPNGLHVLDKLGVFERIKDRCWISTHRTLKDREDNTTRKTYIVNDAYRYTNHRIWRRSLLDEMKAMLAERSTMVKYNSKFDGIVEESSEGVKYLINGDVHHASLLVGSDGIYSSVRTKYVATGVFPEYTGIVGILGHIRYDSVDWPYPDYERQATIQDKPGAIFWIPEDKHGENLMIGLQISYPQQSRDDLKRLDWDKNKLAELYRRDYDEYGSTAKKVIDSMTANRQTLFCWPYMRMPKMDRWFSEQGHVIIVGDAAHALPPSSAQGVNQALEDVYSLSLLLAAVAGKHKMAKDSPRDGQQNGARKNPLFDALTFWHGMRQQKIDDIFDFASNETNVQRMSATERDMLLREGKLKTTKAGNNEDMSWLFTPRLDENVQAWVEANL